MTALRSADPVGGTGAVRARPGLGLAQGIALYLAAVLGTGLLVLPGLAAKTAGPASLVAVAVITVLAVPLAGAFAALAARHPDPGGVASYARRALGPTAARATGYWFLFGVAAGGPVVAVLGARYIATVVGIDPSGSRGSRWGSSSGRSSPTCSGSG